MGSLALRIVIELSSILPVMILIDTSYVVIGIVLITQIRKRIKKEMQHLSDIRGAEERLVREV